MPKNYTRKAAAKITFTHHVGTFYQNMKLAVHPAFVHSVAKDATTFDPLDIVYHGPLALFKSMIPFVVGGAKAVYKNHQRKQRLKTHAHWTPLRTVTSPVIDSPFFNHTQTPKIMTPRQRQQRAIRNVLKL